MEDTWKKKWSEDLDFLKQKLIKKHKNLFFKISEDKFNEMIEKLKEEVDNLEYDDMKVEISRIVAAIGDAHTAVLFPVNKYLPVKFYCFEDGVYIIKVNNGYDKLLYRKVEYIEGVAIDEVLSKLSNIISHENEFLLKSQAAKYLQAVDVLYGLYLCDNKEKVKITVEGKEIILKTFSPDKLNYIEVKNLPIYAKNSYSNYWFEEINDEIYIKYNSCREDGIKALNEKIKETINFINDKNIFKFTLPNSKFIISYSTKYYKLIDDDDMLALYPDRNVYESISDYCL